MNLRPMKVVICWFVKHKKNEALSAFLTIKTPHGFDNETLSADICRRCGNLFNERPHARQQTID